MNKSKLETPLIIAACLSIIYGIVDVVAGFCATTLPGKVAVADFPVNMLSQMPVFRNFVTYSTIALFVLGAAFIIAGIGLSLRQVWPRWVALASSALQIAGLIYIAIYYYKEILPAVEEIFLIFGRPDNAWLLETGGIVLFTELAALIPEIIIILLLIDLSSRRTTAAI
ncbi:hypothetical protein DRQ36_09575 [bacterium]|nr:MAG: hypothetical protein DRQ36_09575 [bacterium]